MANYRRKRRIGPGVVIKRILLTFFTFLLMIIITVFSACFMITHGPSESLCKMLVISAEQASATKWAPYLFLSKAKVKSIMDESKKVNVDEVDENSLTDNDKAREIEKDDNGLKLVFFT